MLVLDLKFIRENRDKIIEAAKNKHIKIDIDALLEIDDEKRKIQKNIDNLNTERNKLAGGAKAGKPSQEQIEKGRKLKSEVAKAEVRLKEVEEKYEEIAVKVPTIPSKDTPIGKDDSENVEVYKWKEPTKFDFDPKSYLELANDLDLLDLERGTKVAGYRGYYVKNEAVMLQMGMMMYALEKLISKGFIPMIPPTLVKGFALYGSGYFKGIDYNSAVDEIYRIERIEDKKIQDQKAANEDNFNKYLVGTAEPSLLAYYADEILDEKDLPIKICGFSQCYRSEIGSYGKDTKGIYRVHEFMKVEQVCITRADSNESDKLQQEMIGISKELHEDLGLPYRQLQICTGDMSAGKYRQYDLEAWMPSRNSYGETGSCSSFLDWQSRRLNVKYKDKEGKKKYVYMLNNTALPSVRPMIAIMENYQQKDGSIVVPEVLRKFVGKDVIKK